ncbi:MAG: filamentous hemagglutinin N-terminal domain-containing protein [Bdellovibrionales bacterium]
MIKNCSKNFIGAASLMTAVLVACPALATTLPTGGTFTGGAGSITTDIAGTTKTISHTTQNAIIDWTGFDISSDGTVDFQQLNSSSITINRINQGSASQIGGKLKANGNLILINQRGINFNSGSTVSVGGLVATTSDYDSGFDENNNFKTKFKQGIDPSAKIVNNGAITVDSVNSSGLAALVAPSVENGSTGVITATAGKVHLEAGDTFAVDFYGDGLTELATNGAVSELLAKNSGKISADDGLVQITADAAKGVVDGLINMDGIIEANRTTTAHSKVVLIADAVEMKNATITAQGSEISVTGTGGYFKSKTNIHKVGVSLDNTTIDAGTGRVSIEGYGYNGVAAKPLLKESYGVHITNGSVINTTGEGTITINGTGGNGAGYRSPLTPGAGSNIGVLIEGAKTMVSSTSGLITIEGHGGGTESTVGSSHDHGVMVSGGADVSSTIGNIDITGWGGGCGNGCGYNYGVYITGEGSRVASDQGDIDITGYGGGTEEEDARGHNYGVFVTDSARVVNIDGEITITGIGGGTGTEVHDNYGIIVTEYATIGKENVEGKDGDRRDISFITDEITMDDTARVFTMADVSFEPYTPSTTISVAGIADTTSQLQITDTILKDIIGASSITVGNTTVDTGLITARAYDWNANNPGADVRFLNYTGDIHINGMQTMGDSTLLAHTVNGNIEIGVGGGAVSTNAGERAIILAASAGTFKNYAGSGALSAPNGRWLVYSYSPVGDIFDNLNSNNTAIWHTVYDGTTLPQSGDRYVFAVPMRVKVILGDLAKAFGVDYTTEVAHDSYTTEGLSEGVLNAFLPDTLFTATTGTMSITSVGSPASAAVGSYPINLSGLTGVNGYTFSYVLGTLKVTQDLPPPNDLLLRTKTYVKRGPYGTLLAIVNTPLSLSNLAPAAGGNVPVGNLADLSPKAGGNMGNLADLSPKAGGNASITPLIQCNEVTPCDTLQ